MITGAKLKNWRSHLSSELAFTKGTNALLGHMGSGKTTILDAICFALFGTFPNLQSRKMKLDDLLMNKPSAKDMAEVEVSFEVGDKKYSVKRMVEKRKGTTYSEIRENGKLLEAPSTQRVNELIENILKVDYELFSKAIYSEQNALDYFLTIPKGQRMKKIDELLMIDRFEMARSSSVSLVNKIAERKFARQSSIDRINMAELESTVKNLKLSLDGLLSDKDKFANELGEIQSQKNVIDKEVSSLQKMRENYEMLKREESGISSTISEISLRIEKLEKTMSSVDKGSITKNLSALSKFLEKATDMLDEKRVEEQKMLQQFSKMGADAEFYRKEVKRLNDEIVKSSKMLKETEDLKKEVGKRPEKETDKKKRLIGDYVGKLESVRIRINDLKDVIEQLNSIKAKCPICESKLTEEKKIVLVKQKQRQIDDLKEEFREALRQKEISEKDLQRLEQQIDRLDELLVAVKDHDKMKRELDSQQSVLKVLLENTQKQENVLKETTKSLQELQKKVSEAQTEKQRLGLMSHYLMEYETSKGRINGMMRQRDTLVSHLQEVESVFSDKDLQNMENNFRILIGKEKELMAKKDALDNLIDERQGRLVELERLLSNAKKEKDEIRKLDDVIIQLKIFEKALSLTQIQLRQEFITAVNYSMNEIWKTLYPYRDFPDIRLNVDEGDYVLQLQTLGNEWVNADGIVSGGERSLAALALRISFSLVLAPQLRWLFLDEPTANLDSEAIRVLSDTLRERIGEFVDQTFLITHTPDLEGAVTGFAYKLERNKSTDAYTEISQLN
ncbi:MAG: SMC family ATPase [Candidatus Aenigmarchaeota archaeon]|nr:SMC family ATPase [Candidatus Aenigmarchaeota archaeon]